MSPFNCETLMMCLHISLHFSTALLRNVNCFMCTWAPLRILALSSMILAKHSKSIQGTGRGEGGGREARNLHDLRLQIKVRGEAAPQVGEWGGLAH